MRYVFVHTDVPSTRGADIARPPYYVTERGARLNLEHYLEKKLKNPFCDYLEAIVGEAACARLFDPQQYARTVGGRVIRPFSRASAGATTTDGTAKAPRVAPEAPRALSPSDLRALMPWRAL